MDCRKFRNSLDEYLEEGMDFAGRFGMERHAEQCFGCQREAREAERLGRLARQVARVRAPKDFEEALLERIHARGGERRPAWLAGLRERWHYRGGELGWRSLVLAAGGASALVVLGFGLARVVRHSAPADVLAPVTEGAAPPAAPGVSLPSEPPRATDPPPYDLAVQGAGPRSSDGTRLPADKADSDYVEYTVPGPDGRELIMRLPQNVRMHYEQPSEEYFLRNVSH